MWPEDNAPLKKNPMQTRVTAYETLHPDQESRVSASAGPIIQMELKILRTLTMLWGAIHQFVRIILNSDSLRDS
jgi:hypothetical protein